MKPTKLSIAIVLINPGNNREVLAVKRPSIDDVLPNVWGLPAITLTEGELPEAAVKRLGNEKLATEIIATRHIGIRSAERENHNLILMEIEAKLLGSEPSVQKAVTSGTKYVDQRWVSDYTIFIEAASNGSLCSQIFLDSKGLPWN